MDSNTGNGRTVLTVAHNTTVNLVCIDRDGSHNPTWLVNGTRVGTEGRCSRSSLNHGGMATATLTIDGNCTCDTLNIHCDIIEERQLVSLHNTTLTIQG